MSDDLQALVERWAAVLPPHLRQAFRDDFARVAEHYDQMLETIQKIWQRRDQTLSLDESTGLARRRPFLDHLAAVLAPGGSSGRAVAVLFLDVNNLKHLNDTFGHDAGDRALAAVGRIIREAIRVERQRDFSARAPTGNDYSVSRHGGDEFLVALELDHADTIDLIAPRIKRDVDDPARQLAQGHQAAPISVSMGGVVYELPVTAPAVTPHLLARALIAAADEQMYAAKRDGGIHLVPARFTDGLQIDRDQVRVLRAT
jgi:diguanylate cyclase (GGDEF)-like protein